MNASARVISMAIFNTFKLKVKFKPTKSVALKMIILIIYLTKCFFKLAVAR